MFSSGNEEVKRRAMLVLAFIGSDSDVSKIAEFATATTNLQSFRYAVIALKRMTAQGGDDAIDMLFAESTAEKLKIMQELGLSRTL